MNVVGHGIDIVDKKRFEKLFGREKTEHLDRYFTQNELAEHKNRSRCMGQLANRLAAKEAVMKALEHGFGDGLAFTDIEIVTLDSGAPAPILSGKAKELAEQKNVQYWKLSLSSSAGVAVASAIACS